MRLSPGLLALAVLAAACGDELSVKIEATPREGIAPLAVRLVAEAHLGENAAEAPRYRFDFDDDGVFETEYADTAAVEHTFDAAGEIRVAVEAIDVDGRTALAKISISPRANQPPAAVLEVSPEQGRQTLVVTLDPSKSVDPDQEPQGLEARFDFDGDGTFDTEWAALAPVTHGYSVAGPFTPAVEVRDWRGGTAVVSSRTITVLPGADLDADTNRDGVVSDLDEVGEEQFTDRLGAVFLANVDDDDANRTPDWRDAEVNGDEDRKDLATILVRGYPGLPQDSTVTLSVKSEVSPFVRLFVESGGAFTQLKASNESEVPLDPAQIAAGDLVIAIEALRGRSPEWDGRVELTLTVARSDDGTTESDTVAMRVSPVLLPDNTLPANRVYIMQISDRQLFPNLPFYETTVEVAPEGVEVYTVDQYRYLGDRWLQDNMQTGYQSMPSSSGMHVMQSYLETARPTGWEGLEYFVTSELLGADFGYFYPGGFESSLNYGGNLEIAPPYSAGGTDHPFGRTLVGGGAGGTILGRSYEDGMAYEQRAWLDAQPQGPTLEISSEWLYVGHLDEIFQFVPNPSRSNGKDFMLVLASPNLALQSLETLSQEGFGGETIFAGRSTQTSVERILRDAELVSFNEAVQERIHSIRALMMQELGLTDADIVEVPVVYEPIFDSGYDFGAAYSPGVQNLVVLRDTLLVPDPEGPDREGEDVWQRMTRDVLEPLGLSVHFVDVFESYHLNFGEAHCGTEVEHAPYSIAWWERNQ
jgi:protein-arginine deiminase